MKNILIFIFLFFSKIFFSQDIKMELRIVDENKVLITEDVIETEYVFEINLSNNSDYDYIIPIDTANYRFYFPEETCANFYRLENYPDLGIIFKIKNEKNEYMDSLLSGFIHLTEEELLAVSKKRKEKERIHREKIKNWKKRSPLPILKTLI